MASNVISLSVVAGALAAGWGLGCGLFERVFLAPRHRLSAAGPAYLPAMLLALLAGSWSAVGVDRVRLIFGVLIAAVFFLIGAVPALGAFHLSRWLLRTRFADEKTTSGLVL
jgi:hypothetical protein